METKTASQNLTWLCDSIELANALGSTVKDLVGDNSVKVDGQMVTFYDEIGINTETRMKLQNLSGGRLQTAAGIRYLVESASKVARFEDFNQAFMYASTNGGQVVDTWERASKVAHDSGDGERIFHCPFCGGGQVLGRSDGTTMCDFCHMAFTVQVQPEHPSMPQTINGQPVDVPGMPGQIDPPELPAEQPMEDVPQPGENPVEDQANLAEEHPLGAVPPPEFQTTGARFYLTKSAVALSEESYLRHLALAHADDREGVLVQVRAENEGRV